MRNMPAGYHHRIELEQERQLEANGRARDDTDTLIAKLPNLSRDGLLDFAQEIGTVLAARSGVRVDPFQPGCDTLFRDACRLMFRGLPDLELSRLHAAIQERIAATDAARRVARSVIATIWEDEPGGDPPDQS